MLIYLFLIGHLTLALLLFFLVLAFVTGAPYVPSSSDVARTMIELAHIQRGMTVYDLGSGDGKLLLLAEQKGAKAIGIEINPYLVFVSRLRAIGKNIRVFWGSFWNANLNDADILFVYLLPWRMEALSKLITKQCKKGTLVVSNSFVFPNWPVLRKNQKHHVYVFKVQ